jgi:hypothetical protein
MDELDETWSALHFFLPKISLTLSEACRFCGIVKIEEKWAMPARHGKVISRVGNLVPASLPKVGWSCRYITRHYSNDSKDSGWSPSTGGLIYPESPSSQHHDLKSFLAYAHRVELDTKSTVYVGTHYEYTVAATLARYGFYLKRVGGSSDYGTDLLGTWTPPTTSQTIRALIQCKAGVQRSGPNMIRELEGAFAGAPVGWRGERVMALLVAERPATKGVRDSLGRSRWPMGYVCCTKDGSLKQMIWNVKAEQAGLEGFGVTSRHVEGSGESELVLMCNGDILPLLDDVD